MLKSCYASLRFMGLWKSLQALLFDFLLSIIPAKIHNHNLFPPKICL
jgi:hypothetical protein